MLLKMVSSSAPTTLHSQEGDACMDCLGLLGCGVHEGVHINVGSDRGLAGVWGWAACLGMGIGALRKFFSGLICACSHQKHPVCSLKSHPKRHLQQLVTTMWSSPKRLTSGPNHALRKGEPCSVTLEGAGFQATTDSPCPTMLAHPRDVCGA